MDPANEAHSEDLTYWDNEEIRAITAIALPPLPDINTDGDSSQVSHQLPVGPSSSSGARKEKRDYMPFSLPETEMLITGVSMHGRIWKEIKRCYFKDSGRTENRLKEKWRHMLKSKPVDEEKNPRLKELYLRAKDVDALYPTYYFRRNIASDTHVV